MSRDTISTQNINQDQHIYKKAIRGGGWMTMLRIFLQFVTFLKRVALAHLLMPADFGLFAIAMLTLGMSLNFTQLNFNSALIHKKDAENYLDVAWTMGLIRGLIIFVLIFFFAGFVVPFFESTKPLTERDISKPAAIVQILDDTNTHFANYLKQNISEDTVSAIETYKADSSQINPLKEALAQDFNLIIQGDLIYTPDRFEDIELSKYTLGYVHSPDTIEDVARVNKLLLQEAFPLEIKTTVFNIPLAINIVRLIGLAALLSSLSNIGIVYFSKNLEFHKKFIMDAANTFVSAAITIILAFIYRNIWSLVIGSLIGTILTVLLSYYLHPYRPELHIEKEKVKSLWKYCRHLLHINILAFINQNIDYFLVGRIMGISTLGLYRQAYKTGDMLTTELCSRISEVAMPVYAKIQDDLQRIRNAYLKMIRLLTIIVFPVTGALIVCAPEFVINVFGEKWIDIVPAFRLLCLLGPIRCFQRGSVFYAIGRPDVVKRVMFLRFILLIISMYPLVKFFGMNGAAVGVIVSFLICEPFNHFYMSKYIGLKVKTVFCTLLFPCFVTLVVMLAMFPIKFGMDGYGLIKFVSLFFSALAAFVISLFLGRYSSPQNDYIKLFMEMKKGL